MGLSSSSYACFLIGLIDVLCLGPVYLSRTSIAWVSCLLFASGLGSLLLDRLLFGLIIVVCLGPDSLFPGWFLLWVVFDIGLEPVFHSSGLPLGSLDRVGVHVCVCLFGSCCCAGWVQSLPTSRLSPV